MASRQPANGNWRVGELVQRYLDRHTNHSAPRTRESYARALTSFVDCVDPSRRVIHCARWFVAKLRGARPLPFCRMECETGCRWCERIWTVIPTYAQQSRSVFKFLLDSVHAYFGGGSPPLLLPSGS